MRSSVKVRRLLVSAAAGVALLVPVAPPAAATHDSPRCIDVYAGLPDVTASVCVYGYTGLYDPYTISCDTIFGCWARATAGYHGSTDLTGEVCVDGLTATPLCTGLGTGQISLVPIPPQTVCFNDSPWGPPCVPHDG